MSLPEYLKKINPLKDGSKGNVETIAYDEKGEVERFGLFRKFFLALVIVLVALLSFGLGKLSVVGKKEPIRIEFDQSLVEATSREVTTNISPQANAASAILSQPTATGAVVASSRGAKYHYPHCSGAKQIKEENKITFATKEAAEAAGYTLAANCKPR